MTALALKQEGPADLIPVPASEAAAILHMIERAARDPSVDVQKLERLMSLREQAETRQAEREFDGAMTDAQTSMGRVRADSNNPQTKSKYASYAALDRALRPAYTQHGFALSFNTETVSDAAVRVICRVSHKAGAARTYQIDMPADGKGAKGGDVMTKTHATGSAVSYGMRYLLKMIFNIAVGDDDGNAAGATEPSGPISEDQFKMLMTLADDVGADKQKFCEYMKVDGIAAIPASQFRRAVEALEAKRGRK